MRIMIMGYMLLCFGVGVLVREVMFDRRELDVEKEM